MRLNPSPLFAALWISLIVVPIVSNDAIAGQPARADLDEVNIYDSANPDSEVIETLSKGTPLAVSNVPTQGFHKARLQNGTIGWVRADEIVVFPRSRAKANEDGTLPPGSSPPESETGVASRVKKRRRLRAKNAWPWRVKIRALGGGLYAFPSALNTAIGGNAFSFGFSGGGELLVRVTRFLSLSLRGEYQFLSAAVVDSSDRNYSMSLTSVPILAGVEIELFEAGGVDFNLSLQGGIGLTTLLTSAASDFSAPNVTQFPALISPAAMGTFKMDWNASEWFGVFFDAGYRFLRTAEVSPLESVNGTTVFDPQTFVIDLSGLIVSLGVSFRF